MAAAKKPAKGPPRTPQEAAAFAQRRAAAHQDKALGSIYTNEGINAANAAVDKFLPTSGIQQVSTDVQNAPEQEARSKALADKYGSIDPNQQAALDQMKAGLGGYTSPEYQAQREQMQKGIQSNLATNMDNLAQAQARGKVYGAAASAQQANQITGANNNQNDLEQQLYVKNIDEQQSRLGKYNTAQGAATQEAYTRASGINNDQTKAEQDANAAQLERQKINMGEEDAYTAARLGTYLGVAGAGASKAQTQAAMEIQKQALNKLGRGV